MVPIEFSTSFRISFPHVKKENMGGWEFSGWEFIRVAIFRVAIFRVGAYQVGVFWVGVYRVGVFQYHEKAILFGQKYDFHPQNTHTVYILT